MSRYYDYFEGQSHTAGEVTIDELQKPRVQTSNLTHWQRNCSISEPLGIITYELTAYLLSIPERT